MDNVKISYERAIELLKGCLNYFVNDTYETAYALNEAREAGFSDFEIEDLGFEFMLDCEEGE